MAVFDEVATTAEIVDGMHKAPIDQVAVVNDLPTAST